MRVSSFFAFHAACALLRLVSWRLSVEMPMRGIGTFTSSMGMSPSGPPVSLTSLQAIFKILSRLLFKRPNFAHSASFAEAALAIT